MRTRFALAISLLVVAADIARAQRCRSRWIIDTKIGADIDDAFALAYAHASHARSDINIRGITTVGDQADERAWIVCRFLTHSKSPNIPVAAGAEPQPKLGIDWQIRVSRHPAPFFNRTQKPRRSPPSSGCTRI